MNSIYKKEDITRTKLDEIRNKYNISEDLIDFSVCIKGESVKNYKNYFYYTSIAYGNTLTIGFVKSENRFRTAHIDNIGDKIINMPLDEESHIKWKYVDKTVNRYLRE